MFSILDGRSKFYQWDKDRKLVVDDETITQVHFANCLCPNAQVSEVYSLDGIHLADVPNDLLTEYMDIRVWAYDGEMTRYDDLFEVVKRTKPSDYIYTPTEVLTLGALEARIAALEEQIKPVAFTIDGVEYEVAKHTTWSDAIEKYRFGSITAVCCGTQSAITYEQPWDKGSYIGRLAEGDEMCNACGETGKDAEGNCATCGSNDWQKMTFCMSCGGYFTGYVKDSNGNKVKGTDAIKADNYTSIPAYITFAINGEEYKCVEGETWSDACHKTNVFGTINCISCGQYFSEYQPVWTSAAVEGIGKVVLEGTLDCAVCYSDTTTPDNLDKVCSTCGQSIWASPNCFCPNCGEPPIKGVVFDARGNHVDASAPIEPGEYIWNKEAF